ncbi:MAG: B3/4 domain-containing protein [Desulfopila sp.]
MKFIVRPEVFAALPQLCFGVVRARGLDNSGRLPQLAERLALAMEAVRNRYSGTDSHDIEGLKVYRDAFSQLGYNPNKFMCSIEAMVRRVLKGGDLPSINGVVDLGNSISLKYLLPIGAHDIGAAADDIEVRHARVDDTFTPFGAEKPEKVASGEVVYARGNSVKTRRWIWRQGVPGMIDAGTTEVFYPIDGFAGVNDEHVIAARDELAAAVETTLGGQVAVGWVDAVNPEFLL